MLVTNIFYVSYNGFYPSQTNFNFLFTFILSSANAFNLDQTKNLSFGKELKRALLCQKYTTQNKLRVKQPFQRHF